MKWLLLAVVCILAIFGVTVPLWAKKTEDADAVGPTDDLPPLENNHPQRYFTASDYTPPPDPLVYAPVQAIPAKVIESVKQDPKIYGPDSTGQPRGIRNNNPGNLRESGAWLGNTGNDDKGFEIFDSPEHGIRALTATLWTTYFSKGINTCAAIFQIYAPSSDSNDPSGYAAIVAKALGVSVTQSLQYRTVIYHLVLAIGNVENGKALTTWYTLDQINNGVNAGLTKVGQL